MVRRSKTVASQLVRGIMLAVQGAGVSPAEFTRRTGVALDEANDPRERIGRAKYERVLAVLHEVLGIQPSQNTTGFGWLETAFPLLTAAWLNAPCARAALQTFLTYRPLVGESDWVNIRERSGVLLLEYVAEGPQGFAAAQAAANFGFVVNILRNYVPASIPRLTTELTGPPPPGQQPGATFAGRILYGQRANVLRIPTEGLDAPYPHYNAAAGRIIERRLAEELAELNREASLGLTVERALFRATAGKKGLPVGQVLDRVCADLRITRWTLRRRLGEEGLTFKELHARVKAHEARRLLETTSLSIAEVSDHLGFATQGSFTRFFRNEVGTTPQQYRRSSGVR